MKADDYYTRIFEAVQKRPEERHRDFSQLHDQILTEYINAIHSLSAEQACQNSSDGRTLAQVVAHIAEWDRYLVLAAGEMLAGVKWPQMMRFTGYVDSEGETHSFNSIDAFNEYQHQKYAAVPWDSIQETAIDMAVTFHALLTNPALLNTSLLEKGRTYDWKMPNGQVFPVPIGWFLWNINLEHEGVDHALDLGLGK